MKTSTIIIIALSVIILGAVGYVLYKREKTIQDAKKMKLIQDGIKDKIATDALNGIKPVTDVLNTLSNL